MINAVTLCILVPWIDETGSWSVTAEAHCNVSVVDVHMYMAGRAEKRMNQMHHRNTVRW